MASLDIDPEMAELDKRIKEQESIISKVLLIVRSAKRIDGERRSGTLRQAIERDIREAFDFDLLYCPRCSRWMTISNFSVDRSRLHGHRSTCRDCTKQVHQSAYWNDPEYHRAVARAGAYRRGSHKFHKKSIDYIPRRKGRADKQRSKEN